MSDVIEDELVDIGCRMAQELQDVLSEAEMAGCEDPFPHMKELINDWEAVYARSDSSMLAKLNNMPGNTPATGLKNL